MGTMRSWSLFAAAILSEYGARLGFSLDSEEDDMLV